ncbi:hypothetical protein NIIDMKKI_61940 [Mycobacterium kansasii]|uniref:Uncharacterized protein n=1 Tax=Mycobacterium kansasii TaxID=1768 RepID=A0A7G1IQF4_MYCKA|nr:hypothetical protein NIIDMKKI_61940 [Mycobacterium kansasii]
MWSDPVNAHIAGRLGCQRLRFWTQVENGYQQAGGNRHAKSLRCEVTQTLPGGNRIAEDAGP